MIAQIIELIVLVITTIVLVVYYSDSDVKLFVKIVVAISWAMSFLIILILPADIAYTMRGEDLTNIKNMWVGIYYANFIFTWIILPIMQHYEDAGQFTWKGKLKRSLINNGIMVAVFIFVGILLIIYLIVRGQFSFKLLPSVFATIANVFGILLVVIFLGHGLISLPKHCFLRSSNKKTLSRNYKTASLVHNKMDDLQFDIDIGIRKINYLQTKTDFLISNLASQILNQIPQNIRSKTNANSKTFDLIDVQNPNQAKMIQLSQKIKKNIRQFMMYQSWLKDLIYDTKFVSNQTSKNNYKYLKVLYISLMIITIFLSTVIFIGQISSFVPILDKINILIYVDNAKSAVSYILNSLLLLYMTYIITHAIFEMNIFGMFNLHKKHSTASSLLFMSINLARISYPLCYNYLQITGMPQIAFLQFFGQIQLGGNNVYIFPILLITFGVFNLLSIYDKVMGCFGLGRYAFSQQDQTTEQQGKRVIQQRIRKSQLTSQKLSNASGSSKNGAYLQLQGL